MEELHKLPNLSEVSFEGNPICVHKHLTEMVRDVVPEIEVVNQQILKESGFRFKEEFKKLREKVKELKVGTAQGDRLLEDAEEDPDLNLLEANRKHEKHDSSEEETE